MTEQNGLMNINVIICDRQYKLKVKPEEEEIVRKAAKNISEKVKQFQIQFEGKDKQDYLAMCSLMVEVDKYHLENKQLTSSSDVFEELDQLNSHILKALLS